MKKKLLSFALALVMITMTITTTIPAFADTVDYDAKAAEAGYVARIGEAETAYDGGNYTGYYKYLDATYSNGYEADAKTAFADVAESDVKTITLIAENIYLNNQNGDITLPNGVVIVGAEPNGKNITVHRLGNFTAKATTYTIKNVTVSMERQNGTFANASSGGYATFENCIFTTTKDIDYGLFMPNGGTIKIVDSTVLVGTVENGVVTAGVSALRTDSSLFWSNTTGSKIVLDNVTADISKSESVIGMLLKKGGTVNMTDTTLVTNDDTVYSQGSQPLTVTVAGSTADKGCYLECTGSRPTINANPVSKVSIHVEDSSKVIGNGGNAINVCNINGATQSDILISGNAQVNSKSANAINLAALKGNSEVNIGIYNNAILNGNNGISGGTGTYALNVAISDNASVSGTLDGIIMSAITGDTSVTMNDSSKLNGGNSGLSIEACLGDINVEMNGNAQINANAVSDDDCVFISGKKSELKFVMNDTSSINGSKNGLNISDATNDLQPVSITMNDQASINSSTADCSAILIGRIGVTLDLNDSASLDADIPFNMHSANVYSTVTIEDTVNLGDMTTTVAPETVYGASIRTVGTNGIRFSADVDSDKIADAKDYGILIVKYNDLSVSDFTVYSMDKNGVTYGAISAKDDNGSGVSVNGDGTTTFTVVLTDLPDMTEKFAVRAYAVYTVNGVDVYVYSDFTEDANVRSMANVAYSALYEDVKDTNDEANGYIYEVKDGVWSRYTTEQYSYIETTYGGVATPKTATNA